MGGHVQMMFDAITTMASNARAGTVRPSAPPASSAPRFMPDVRRSRRRVCRYEATIWLGIMAPAERRNRSSTS